MRLFHFSEDPAIERFVPRPVSVPSQRPPGREWLNGPLVWAIDELRQPMYFFPRDCPRILLWPTPQTTAADLKQWWSDPAFRMIAFMEKAWLERFEAAVVSRYELPLRGFERLDDAGMWVHRDPVTPLAVDPLGDLAAALAAEKVELRLMDSLTPLRGVWDTTLHASGIRLRNAAGWN